MRINPKLMSQIEQNQCFVNYLSNLESISSKQILEAFLETLREEDKTILCYRVCTDPQDDTPTYEIIAREFGICKTEAAKMLAGVFLKGNKFYRDIGWG